jgi:hypothetical protein
MAFQWPTYGSRELISVSKTQQEVRQNMDDVRFKQSSQDVTKKFKRKQRS